MSSPTGNSSENDFNYKSSIAPPTVGVNRGLVGVGVTGGAFYKQTVQIATKHMSSGHFSKEKQELAELNARLIKYVEKVRFLEADKRTLASERDELKGKWGRETSTIKTMYETKLKEARDVLEETTKEKNKLEVKLQSMQDQMNNIQRQLDDAKTWRSQDREMINKLNQQVSDQEAELRMLRRTKQVTNRINEELEKLRQVLSNETIQRLDAENRAQKLAEDLGFLKSVHEQELKELAALAYRDTTAENREFWKREVSQAIRDIQNEYDSWMESFRVEMDYVKVQEFHAVETRAREEKKKVEKTLNDYKMKVTYLETQNNALLEKKEKSHQLEVKQLLEERNKLRADVESKSEQLQKMIDSKMSLELEIAAYRKVLEKEENRVELQSEVEQTMRVGIKGTPLRAEMINVSQSDYKGTDSKLPMEVMRREAITKTAKFTYKSKANGPVSIAETDPEGKFIVLSNKPTIGVRTDVNLMNWTLQRKVDGKSDISYKFPNAVIKQGKTMKIWAGKFSAECGSDDLVFNEAENWGVGSQITTTLLNEKNEEKASHIQETV